MTTSGDDDGEEGRGSLVNLPTRAVRRTEAPEPDEPEDAARPAEDEEALRLKLELLRQEHRDVDHAITALQDQGGDPFTIKRFKAQKLRLKDRIARIEDQITPDIIA